MRDCSHLDVVSARKMHNEIRNLVKAQERGEGSESMLHDIKVLCICIIHTIRDPYCQDRMGEVAVHADQLFAVGERSDRGMLPIFLRRLIFKSLQAFDDRLRSLETTESRST